MDYYAPGFLPHDGPTMRECMPADLAALDVYQEAVVTQRQYDENGVTILGYPPEVYMYLGLCEELREVYGKDRIHPEYSRLRGLLGNSVQLSRETAEKLSWVESEQLAIQLHLKEFGDVSWYLANLLNLYGITMSEAVAAGEAAWEEEAQTKVVTKFTGRTKEDLQTFLNTPEEEKRAAKQEFRLGVERALPAVLFVGRQVEIAEVTMQIMAAESQETREELARTGGKLILAMALVTKSLFGVPYQEILAGNVEKINKRIKDGTVFDKTGGDTR